MIKYRMRLFIAVNFSDEEKTEIFEIEERLRSMVPCGNFSRLENLHLTLAFLGETPEEKFPLLSRIIDEIKFPPFVLSFDHAGRFHQGRGELWWIGANVKCAGFSSIKDIHAQLNRRLEDESFPVERRPFKAHITIARGISRGRSIVLDCPEIKIHVDRVSLMKSEHIRGVLTYTELAGSIFR